MSALASTLRVLDDGVRVELERRLERLARGHGDRRGGVVVRAALEAGEHRLVDDGGVLLLAEDHAAARAAEGLVRRRRDDVGEADGGGVRADRDEPRDVRDVGRENGADLVRDRAERSEVEGARVGGRARPEELRLVLLRELADLVHVDAVVLAAHAVGHALEVLAGDRDGVAVREVAARGQAEAHDDVAGLAEREVDGEVRGAARVRLHVDVEVVLAARGGGARRRAS